MVIKSACLSSEFSVLASLLRSTSVSFGHGTGTPPPPPPHLGYAPEYSCLMKLLGCLKLRVLFSWGKLDHKMIFAIMFSVNDKMKVSSCPEFIFGAKKTYLTKIIFQVRFKRATVNNSGGKETQHASHRNFWNLSTKVGGVAGQKFGPIPQFGDFRSNFYFNRLLQLTNCHVSSRLPCTFLSNC